ncbi:F0F1 ATP synthase subunit A [bacterium]|nr:F0F1 ATP synthase subunit A [bacterium]
MAIEIEHVLGLTKAVNRIVARPISSLLNSLGFENFPRSVKHALELGPQSQVPVIDGTLILFPNHVVETWLVMGIVICVAYWASRGLKKVPSGRQHLVELFCEGLQSMLESVIGPKGPRFFNVIATLALMILCSNLIGLLPFCESPTANLNTNAAYAVFIFLYYHYQGLRDQGTWAYCKHFAGPMPWLAILMVPIELISHFVRPLSLTLRLFGNIKGEDIILIILMSLLPFFLPIPIIVLMIFSSLLQAYIFVMLSMLYLAGAVASEEH